MSCFNCSGRKVARNPCMAYRAGGGLLKNRTLLIQACLWDNNRIYERERIRCLEASEGWRAGELIGRFAELFMGIIMGRKI
jgi:hypothetical protein